MDPSAGNLHSRKCHTCVCCRQDDGESEVLPILRTEKLTCFLVLRAANAVGDHQTSHRFREGEWRFRRESETTRSLNYNVTPRLQLRDGSHVVFAVPFRNGLVHFSGDGREDRQALLSCGFNHQPHVFACHG